MATNVCDTGVRLLIPFNMCNIFAIQAFDKDDNKCKSLLAGKLTKKQEKHLKERAGQSSMAKQMASLESIKEINPVKSQTWAAQGEGLGVGALTPASLHPWAT